MNLGNDRSDGVISSYSVAFVSIHLTCLAVIWTGLSSRAMVLGLVLYVVRIFAIGAGYHQYFAHRAFRTSRVFQFGLVFLSLTSAQWGILWWAAKHRPYVAPWRVRQFGHLFSSAKMVSAQGGFDERHSDRQDLYRNPRDDRQVSVRR
jgi:stearoyl-CoA desaturase (delta-9 desaturase)